MTFYRSANEIIPCNNCYFFVKVGKTTLGGLLALGYNVVVSHKRTCTSVRSDQVVIAAESIDTLNETFLVLKGTSRKVHTLLVL